MKGTQVVVDTSALLAVLTSEPERAALLAATRGATLLAPGSVPWEIGNALSAMLKRRRIDEDQAARIVGGFTRIPLRLIDVDLATAVEVAGRFGLYAYDAYFIVCAAVHRAPILTLDSALARAAKGAGLRTVELT